MKIIKILLFSLSVVFFVAFTNHPSAAETRGVSENLIKIGLIADQTGPAVQATIPYTIAFKNYFRYINDKEGINNKKIKLLVEDDGYSIPRAIAAFKKLIFKDDVFAIMGCGGTGQNAALFREIEKNKVPVISISWSWTTTDPVQKYIFTAANDNKDEIKVIMDYIVNGLKAKNPRITIISPDLEFGKSGAKVAISKAKEYNIEIVGREIVPIETTDATTQILNLKKTKSTHILALVTTQTMTSLLRDARRFHYFPIFFNSFHLVMDEIVKIAGESAENLYGVGAFGSWFDDTEGIIQLKKITLSYNPNLEPPNRYYIKGWIAAKVAHEGLKRAGNNLTPDRFVNALETIKNLDMKGLTGPISYSPKNHKGNDFARLHKADIEKGYFVPITDFIKAK